MPATTAAPAVTPAAPNPRPRGRTPTPPPASADMSAAAASALGERASCAASVTVNESPSERATSLNSDECRTAHNPNLYRIGRSDNAAPGLAHGRIGAAVGLGEDGDRVDRRDAGRLLDLPA